MLLWAVEASPLESLTPGWVSTGIVGILATLLIFVLRWLLFVHLPEKDKQIKEMLDATASERSADRTQRERQVDLFQQALSEQARQHVLDAERDRDAFIKRQQRIEDAIRVQTAELKAALAVSCRYMRRAGDTPDD